MPRTGAARAWTKGKGQRVVPFKPNQAFLPISTGGARKTQLCMSTAKVLSLSLSLACPGVFNSTSSEHFSLPTQLESSSFPLSQSICSFSRAVVNKYLATFLINYMYPPSWNGHPSRVRREKYAGNSCSELFFGFFFLEKEKVSALVDLVVQHHSADFSRSPPSLRVKSPWHIRSSLWRLLHLLVSPRILSFLSFAGGLFCCSSWGGPLRVSSFKGHPSRVPNMGKITSFINAEQQGSNLPNDPGEHPECT